MVRVAEENAVSLAQMAVEETGFGKVADKTYKNHMASTLLYDAIKDMKTIGIVSEDPIARTMDVADPVGLLMGIVPSTNPTSAFSIVFAISGSVSGSAGSGSGITRSIIPSSFNSLAVIFMTRAASSARLLSFHRIDAKPSGERTEYTAFSIIQTSFATAMASAPPLPPSPITMESTNGEI